MVAADSKQAYRELLDPAAFYLPRIERLRPGRLRRCDEEIDAALKALPDDPRLKAERSSVASSCSRRGSRNPKSAATILADAEEALKNPKTFAAAVVTIGKLAESTGTVADAVKAEELYRQALKSGDADERSPRRCKLGLGRLLLRKFAAGDVVTPSEGRSRNRRSKNRKSNRKSNRKPNRKPNRRPNRRSS